MSKITAEIKGDRVALTFDFDAATVNKVKGVRGARFARSGPHWTVPLTLPTARQLRRLFGDQLVLGPHFRKWGKVSVSQERRLRSLTLSDDASLDTLPHSLPLLNNQLRPYQRADTKFMALASCVNGNEPRLGKTLEVIAATYEAGLERGPQLVIAPSEQSMETVWRYELERWQDIPALTLHGGLGQRARMDLESRIEQSLEEHQAFWLITTPHMVRTDFAQAWEWKIVTVDEFHKMGLANPKSALTRSLKELKYERLWLTSGTPMGGMPLKLWAALNLCYPKLFSSKWRWADEWLDVREEEIYVKGGGKRKVKQIGSLRHDREDDFYPAHAQYIVRRLKKEVMPWLPDVQIVNVPALMGKEQAKQYEQFAEQAELRIEELRLTGDSILAEYLWLKRFANTVCRLEEYEAKCRYCDAAYPEVDEQGECVWCRGTKVILKVRALPTPVSGKLDALLDRLSEDNEPAIVSSQFSTMVEVAADYLTAAGMECLRFTGKHRKRGERAELVHKFQSSDGPRIMCMTTTAGGVSINLSRATSTHILDETWDPDDQTQLIERMFDPEREEAKAAFFYRSRDTIDQYVAEGNELKRNINDICLDIHRKRIKELQK